MMAHWDTWDDECAHIVPTGLSEPSPSRASEPRGEGGDEIAAFIRFVVWMGTLPKDVILEHGEPLLRTTSKAKPPTPGVMSKAKPPPPGVMSKAEPAATPWKRRRLWHRNSPSPEPPQLAAQ